MKKIVHTANKQRCQTLGLYTLALERISMLNSNGSGIISFKDIFSKLCTSFQISKYEAWEILFLFQEFDFIEIISGHGIKIKNNSGGKDNGIKLK